MSKIKTLSDTYSIVKNNKYRSIAYNSSCEYTALNNASE